MIISCKTLLLNDKADAIPAELVITIKPTPVTVNVTEFVVPPILIAVSTDSQIVVSVF